MNHLYQKLIKYVDLSNKPDHYIFMHVDCQWGHNDSYYPDVYLIDAYPEDLVKEIAKVILNDKIIENICFLTNLMQLYKKLEAEKSKEIITDDLETEINDIFYNNNKSESEWALKEYLSLDDLVVVLERISQEDGGLLKSFAPGPFSTSISTVLIKDNDRVFEQLFMAGIPCDSARVKTYKNEKIEIYKL